VTELPPGVDLTAYRILQEALTNALRHAPGSAASVRVAREPAQVTVEVSNTARPVPSLRVTAPAASGGASAAPARRRGPGGPGGPGYGLAGIAERVASCGGALALGPTADGGFAVTARLPLT